MSCPIARPLLTTLLFLALVSSAATAQTVIRVMKQNPTPGDGSTWASAYKHPNDALAAASSIPGPIEIWVTTATYLSDKAGTDRTVSFELRGDLEFLGGFVGDEIDKSQRDPAANPTILSGDLGLDFNAANDAFHVVRADSLNGPVIVDGFHIIRGHASQTEGDGLGGGGLLIRNSDVTLRRCVLQYNWAGAYFPDFGDYGGAVHIEGSGALTVEACDFFDNEAYFGGAINVSSDGDLVELSIFDSSFARNRALDGSGGAINFSRGSLTIERTTFVDNRARLAVAIQSTLARQVIVRDCLFDGNRGQQRATVLLDRSDGGGLNPALIERSQFVDNTATSAFGTALSTTSTLLFVSDSEFRRNHNVSVSSVTGDFLGTGTVAVVGRIGHRITNSLFADNFAGNAAGLVLRSAPAIVVNTTFANNHSAAETSEGSGVRTFVDGALELRNVILWGNRLGTGQNDDQPGAGGSEAQLAVAPNTNLILGYSDIEGWMGGAADGTFSADPVFVDPALEDYRLQVGSPAIDAGDNAAVAALPEDLDGQPRITDGLFNGGMRVDLGPYEFAGDIVATPPASDSALALRVSPADGFARIDYHLSQASNVRLEIFDLRGRRVRQLLNATQSRGDRHALWDQRDHGGQSVASGVYLVRLVAGQESDSGKVLVLR